MTDKRIVLCTAGSEDEARKIARHLVEQRLAACVNIVPQIESIYRWQGSGIEPGMVIADQRLRRKDFDCTGHDSQIAFLRTSRVHRDRVEDGSEDYLAWIRKV